MANITFYCKPGCVTSDKQVDLLSQYGHVVEGPDLLSHPCQPEELTTYFDDMPLKPGFIPNSPRVKSRRIEPLAYD